MLAVIIDPSRAEDAPDLSGYDLSIVAPRSSAPETIVWLEDEDIEAAAPDADKLTFTLSESDTTKIKLRARPNAISAAISLSLY